VTCTLSYLSPSASEMDGSQPSFSRMSLLSLLRPRTPSGPEVQIKEQGSVTHLSLQHKLLCCSEGVQAAIAVVGHNMQQQSSEHRCLMQCTPHYMQTE
jgi:hypothetical protein